jgi:formylglycine-generating enzyme required for sulfatase activity
VTVTEWRKFTQATGHTPENISSLHGRADYPVVYVNWDEALKYARWLGMTLPSEAQWEKAARGEDGRVYPWGNEWRPGVANTLEYWLTPSRWPNWLRPRYKLIERTPVSHFSPLGDSPYGCADMAGNVWEWCSSLHQSYPYRRDDGRENLETEGSRVLRGGSLSNEAWRARVACRYTNTMRNGPVGPFISDWDWGFRVGVSAPPTLRIT